MWAGRFVFFRQVYRMWLAVRWGGRFDRLAKLAVERSATRRGPAGRRGDLESQFALVKADFGGRSELLFYLYCCVIRARRGVRPARQAEIIKFCFARHGAQLFSELNTRWLASFLNTVADHGSRGEAEAARALTTFLHMMKIYETVFLPETPDARRRSVARALAYGEGLKPWKNAENFAGLELWDYMFMMAFDTGDVIDNLFTRLNDRRYPFVAASFDYIVEEVAKSDTMFAVVMAENKYTKDLVAKIAE